MELLESVFLQFFFNLLFIFKKVNTNFFVIVVVIIQG